MYPKFLNFPFWSDLSKWWKNFKNKWHVKTPRQKWFVVYEIGVKLSKLIGITVYENVQLRWYSYFPGVIGLIYFSTVFYTLWYYSMKGEFSRGLQCTSSFGIVISVSCVSLRL